MGAPVSFARVISSPEFANVGELPVMLGTLMSLSLPYSKFAGKPNSSSNDVAVLATQMTSSGSIKAEGKTIVPSPSVIWYPPIKIDELDKNRPAADTDAVYARRLYLELDTVQPHVSGPDNVKTMTLVAEMRDRKLKIHKAYLLSCVNSRVEDLAAAAEVMRGKKVAAGVEFESRVPDSMLRSTVKVFQRQANDVGQLVAAGAGGHRIVHR